MLRTMMIGEMIGLVKTLLVECSFATALVFYRRWAEMQARQSRLDLYSLDEMDADPSLRRSAGNFLPSLVYYKNSSS